MEPSSTRPRGGHFETYQALCNAFDISSTEFLDYPGGCLEVSVAALGGSRLAVVRWAQDRINRRLAHNHTLRQFLNEAQLQVAQSLPIYGNGNVDTASLLEIESGFLERSLRGVLFIGSFRDETQHAVAVISSVLAAQLPSLTIDLGNHLIVDVNSQQFYTVAPISTVVHQRGLNSMVGHCIAW